MSRPVSKARNRIVRPVYILAEEPRARYQSYVRTIRLRDTADRQRQTIPMTLHTLPRLSKAGAVDSLAPKQDWLHKTRRAAAPAILLRRPLCDRAVHGGAGVAPAFTRNLLRLNVSFTSFIARSPSMRNAPLVWEGYS